MSKISFTIITVVKNAELLISETLNSILNQSYKNYELILVDGVSTDSTLKKAMSILSSADIKSTILCGPDAGIYDAMNKGIKAASGNFIIFINAGDSFCSADTLENVARFVSLNPHCDVFYGDSLVSYGSYTRQLKAGALEAISYGMQFSHQSTFVRAGLMKEFLFDLRYRIASDFDFLLRLYKSNRQFAYIGVPIAITLHGGLSDSRRVDTYLEYLKIVNKNGLAFMPTFNILLNIALNAVKTPFRYLIPMEWFNKFRG